MNNSECIALLGIIHGMLLMYSIDLLREFYREQSKNREKEKVKEMLRSAIPVSSTFTTYL
jgi:hypothetical protein